MSSTISKPPRAILFINVSHPEARERASKQGTTIRSHAARVTHATARQARTIEYQAAKGATTQQPRPRRSEIDKHGSERGRHHATSNVADEVVGSRTDDQREAVVADSFLVRVPGSERTDPFMSFAKPFTSIEQFLLAHCEYLPVRLRTLISGASRPLILPPDVTAVIPHLVARCRKFMARGFGYIDSMTKEWIRLALGNAGFLDGIFLNASRHLSAVHQQRDQQQLFATLAVRFKLSCVRAVRAAISSDARTKPFSDSVVAVTMVLALDEVSGSAYGACYGTREIFPRADGYFPVQMSLGDLAMSRRHVQGAVRMVELNGGPETLGLNGFLDMVLRKYVGEVGLLNAVPA